VPDQSISILAAQLRLVMRSRAPVYGGSAMTVIAVACLWRDMPTGLLTGWGGAMLAWQAVRYLLWRRFSTHETDAAVAGQARLVTLTWSLTGLLWGVFGAAYLVPADPEARFFMLFVVTANVAGGAVAVAPYIPAQVGYVIGASLPAAVAFLLHGSRYSLLMAGMAAAFAAVARSAALLGNRGVTDLIRLQIENNRLLTGLRDAKESADHAN
jgi:hypothetical protein